jgi:hypothetical protein
MSILRFAVAFLFVAGSAVWADQPKPMKPVKPLPPQEKHPEREALSVAKAIDREIDRRLADAKITASPAAEDGDFIRRASLDLAGRIPTWDRAAAFLDDNSHEKRRLLIDELLGTYDFGRHFADVWKPLLAPRDPANTKPQVDKFSPWLAGEFNRNRGWDKLAVALLGTTGDVKDRPETSFLMTHAEGFQPKADLLASGTGTAFLGVQLQCAECHDHPFAPWKQADYWGLAAFFGKVRNTGTKGPPWVITEDLDPKPLDVKNGGVERIKMQAGGKIVIPSAGGNKGAGNVVAAKLLDGKPMELNDADPFRPQLVEWVTAKGNPYFARNFVNRVWAQLFGRGLVHPLAQMHAENLGTHPEILGLLAGEFVASEFDIKHIFRCICNTRTYQRSSKAIAGSENDVALLSHLAIKPISPEAIYDSIQVVYAVNKSFPSGGKPGVKPVKPEPTKTMKPTKPEGTKPMMPVDPREEFINFFRAQGTASGEFSHGIPQFLRRMNGEVFNAPAPLIEYLSASGAEPEKVIEGLFLATVTRRPTTEEQAVMAKYVAGKSNATEGYAGVLWALLNSGEFVLNR